MIDPTDLRGQLLAAVRIERLAIEAFEESRTYGSTDGADLLQVAIRALEHCTLISGKLRDDAILDAPDEDDEPDDELDEDEDNAALVPT